MKLKYYDYFILFYFILFWISGICGMEQHEYDAVTPFAAAAIAKAIDSNSQIRIEKPGASGQKTSNKYSKVYFSACVLYMKSISLRLPYIIFTS